MKMLHKGVQKIGVSWLQACAHRARTFSTSTINPSEERQIFLREDGKVHVNIGLIGASQGGKTSLASVCTKVLSRTHGVPVKEVEDIDNGIVEKAKKMSQNATHLELWRDGFRYSVTDLPGAPTYQRNLLTHLSQLEACLLIVNPDEGLSRQDVELYKIARHLSQYSRGTKMLVVPVLSTRDSTDAETLDLVRMELEEAGLDEEPVVLYQPLSLTANDSKLSNADNAVIKLFDDLEKRLGTLQNVTVEDKAKVYFPLEQVGAIPRRGAFCAGRLQSGQIKVGQTLEVFYHGSTSHGTVKDMEVFRKRADRLLPGDRCGLFIKFKSADMEVKRGAVLYEQGHGRTAANKWRVRIQCLPGENSIVE